MCALQTGFVLHHLFLRSSPIVAAAPTGHLRSGAAIGELGGKGAGKGKDPAAKPKPKPKPKTAPKAKTPLQEATAVSKLY